MLRPEVKAREDTGTMPWNGLQFLMQPGGDLRSDVYRRAAVHAAALSLPCSPSAAVRLVQRLRRWQ
jgi:hypothetical protein